MTTKRVRVIFSGGAVELDVTLGPLATDAYYCDNARAKAREERDDLGRFRRARIVDHDVRVTGGSAA